MAESMESSLSNALQGRNFGYQDDESDVIIRQIMTMPDGEEKDLLLNQLYQDYEGQEAILEEKIAQATVEMDALQPEGRQAGEVYVAANPMEHMAAALRKGMGGYERAKGLQEMKGLSDDRGAATEFSGKALMNDAQTGMSIGEPVGSPDAGMSMGETAAMSDPVEPAGMEMGQSMSPPMSANPPEDYSQMPEHEMVPSHFVGKGSTEQQLQDYLTDMERQKLPMGRETGPEMMPSHGQQDQGGSFWDKLFQSPDVEDGALEREAEELNLWGQGDQTHPPVIPVMAAQKAKARRLRGLPEEEEKFGYY